MCIFLCGEKSSVCDVCIALHTISTQLYNIQSPFVAKIYECSRCLSLLLASRSRIQGTARRLTHTRTRALSGGFMQCGCVSDPQIHTPRVTLRSRVRWQIGNARVLHFASIVSKLWPQNWLINSYHTLAHFLFHAYKTAFSNCMGGYSGSFLLNYAQYFFKRQ